MGREALGFCTFTAATAQSILIERKALASGNCKVPQAG